MSDYSDNFDSDENLSSPSSPTGKLINSQETPRKSLSKHKKDEVSGATFKKRTRPQSAPSKSRTKETWVGNQSSSKTNSSGKKASVNKKAAVEYWSDALRKSGAGLTPQLSRPDSFSGLKNTKNMGYSSTSHFLRQMIGTEKLKAQDAVKSISKNGPTYKSQEEYYDEIISLKKQIVNLNREAATMKSRLRRVEEDNIKKDKEIDQLLNPSKSDELRRTLGDKKPDMSAIIHSLKQKVHKLEQKLKEKETSYSKLESDLKTTKVEEFRVQNEILYNEIERLQKLKDCPAESANRPVIVKESSGKLKALQETILRMNEENLKLQSENKLLKEDLGKMMTQAESFKHKDYEEMNKKQLLSAINTLEQRLDHHNADNSSLLSDLDKQITPEKITGKLQLEGSVAQRLEQLDKRETELLERIDKQSGVMKRAKEDRAHYRKRCDDKDKKIRQLQKEVDELHAELDGFYEKDRTSPRSARQTGKVKQQSPRPTPRLNRSSSRSHLDDRSQRRKVEEFRQSHAAKTIQSGWRQHRDFQQDEATELIQAAIRGHNSRTKTLQNLKSSRGHLYQSSMSDYDSEYENATEMIQSNIRGHIARREFIQRNSFVDKTSTVPSSSPSQNEEVEDDTTLVMLQSALRGHLARTEPAVKIPVKPPRNSRNFSRSNSSSHHNGLNSQGEETDDERNQGRRRSASRERRSRNQRTQNGYSDYSSKTYETNLSSKSSKPPPSPRRNQKNHSPSDLTDEDESSDIYGGKTRKRTAGKFF